MDPKPGITERLHDRYDVPECAGLTATLDGAKYRIASIGYGGLGIICPTAAPIVPGERIVSLDILGLTFDCPAEVRFQTGAQIGLQFAFQFLDQLERLKAVIPWLALGTRLAEAQTKDASYRCRTASNGELGLQIEFKVGAVTCQVRLIDGKLATWHDLGPGGELVPIRRTEQLDEGVARFAMLAFLGVLSQRPHDSTLDVSIQEALALFRRRIPAVEAVA